MTRKFSKQFRAYNRTDALADHTQQPADRTRSPHDPIRNDSRPNGNKISARTEFAQGNGFIAIKTLVIHFRVLPVETVRLSADK